MDTEPQTIAIAGAHGQVARQLTRLLVERGDTVRGLIRADDQAPDIRDDGGEPVLVDLERDGADVVAEAIRGCDAVVFAAGSGPGSGPDRKWTVDRDGAIRLLGAAQAMDVPRYVMLSSMGTDDPPTVPDDPGEDDVFAVYLAAKSQADEAVMASDRDWTVLRPGGLTDDDPTGQVELGRHVERGQIPRGDVAGVLAAVLHDDATVGLVLEVIAGDTPVADAVAALAT